MLFKKRPIQFHVRVLFAQPEHFGPFGLGDSGLPGVVSGLESDDDGPQEAWLIQSSRATIVMALPVLITSLTASSL